MLHHKFRVKRQFLFFLAIFACIVLFNCYTYTMNGLGGFYEDLEYHLTRIEAVKTELLLGHFPTYIYSLFFGGYGYAGGLFYPDLFLVFPAILRIIGFAPIAAYKLFMMTAVLLVAVSTYFSFRYITKSRYAALVSTILLCFSQYYMANLLVRNGMSEYLSYLFMPIVLAGAYDLFVFEGKKTWLIGVGLAGLLLTHTISFVLCLVLFGISCLFFIPRFIKNPKRIGTLFVTAIITVCAVSFYLFPMIEQFQNGSVKLLTQAASAAEIQTQPIQTFFLASGYFSVIAYVGIGIPVLLLLPLRIFCNVRKHKATDFMIVTGLLLFLATTKYFPWSLLSKTIFSSIQFTFRFYPFALLFLTLGLGMMLDSYSSLPDTRKSLLACVLGLSIFFAIYQSNDMVVINENTLLIDQKFFNFPENTDGVVGGEWLPSGAVTENLLQPGVVISDAGETIGLSGREGNTLVFQDLLGAGSYQIPLLYYLGYQAEIKNENGNTVPLILMGPSENGCIQVDNPHHEKGVVTVYYKGTIIQRLSRYITSITVILLLAYLIRRNRIRKYNNQKRAL